DVGAVRGARVEHEERVAGVDQPVDDGRPDESGPPGHCDFYDVPFFDPTSAMTVRMLAITYSASSRVMSEWMGRQTCRRHTSSATGRLAFGKPGDTRRSGEREGYNSPR